MPTFNLTLQKTYFKMGFFNVGVSYDRHVRKTEGPVRLRLGRDGKEVEARVDRHANQNGTPRIMGASRCGTGSRPTSSRWTPSPSTSRLST
jgi:hypothetical protein